jgi:hypothetical protein
MKRLIPLKLLVMIVFKIQCRVELHQKRGHTVVASNDDLGLKLDTNLAILLVAIPSNISIMVH